MSALLKALEAAGATVTADAPLRRYAFWRVGGPADLLVEANTLEQLQVALSEGPVTPLGRGSNALIHDSGVRGVVLRLGGELGDLRITGTRAVAGGGLSLAALLARLDKAGLAGAEAFAGVPGTMGGAVVINAGTQLGEAKDLVTAVTLVLPGGELLRLDAAELRFAYRSAELPPGAVVAFAELALTDQDVPERTARRRALMERRKATQPLDLPSCGSTFTNPPGDFAGRLIEAAGLKGARIGGAEISPRHANFFVNADDASAEDIRQLIVLARRAVYERFGVLLEPEVRLMGPWGPDAWAI